MKLNQSLNLFLIALTVFTFSQCGITPFADNAISSTPTISANTSAEELLIEVRPIDDGEQIAIIVPVEIFADSISELVSAKFDLAINNKKYIRFASAEDYFYSDTQQIATSYEAVVIQANGFDEGDLLTITIYNANGGQSSYETEVSLDESTDAVLTVN